VLTVVLIAVSIGLFQDFFATISVAGIGVGSFASMMAIGNILDVSDRQTHGSNIAYQVYLINRNQIDGTTAFPSPNSSREVGSVPMASGEYMKYFEAHDIPTYVGSGEKGDITTSGTNTFAIIMGGMRDQLLNFLEEFAGDKFIILFKEVGSTQWNILGNYDRPMILQSFEAKNDKDGRYITYTFTRTSVDQYYKYTGSIVTAAPTLHTAGETALTVVATSDDYTIPNGTSATYAIATAAGLTANSKGRYITLYGTGTTYPATVPDGTTFILEDGTTWTAKAGSRITFRIMDSSTLVEVPGTRVQTA